MAWGNYGDADGDAGGKLQRLRKALEYRKKQEEVSHLKFLAVNGYSTEECETENKANLDVFLSQIQDFFRMLAGRMPDKDLHPIVCKILKILEPPNCYKEHCEHHTAYSFCNCEEERVPGYCAVYAKYKKDKLKRENKTPGKFFPAPGSSVIVVTDCDRKQAGIIGEPYRDDENNWRFPLLIEGQSDPIPVKIDHVVKKIKVIK